MTMLKPGTRILLVEDDRSIARLIELELEHRQLTVRWVSDGLAVRQAVATFEPDAIVLDIMLPGMDGERVLQRLRQDGCRVPVIMLTARDGPHDKVRNLDSGADDYLTKPFEIDELLARLGAILRRVPNGNEVVRVADLDVDLAARRVRRGGREIALTAREYDLLEFLARNPRRVLPRELMLERVWGYAPEISPNVVDVYIGYLRKKIDATGEPHLIQTIRGVGYALREG